MATPRKRCLAQRFSSPARQSRHCAAADPRKHRLLRADQVAGDIRTDFLDDAGDLVAQRERQRHAARRVELLAAAEIGVTVLDVQVGMTQPAALDADQHLLGRGFGVSTMVSHNGASNLTNDWRSMQRHGVCSLKDVGFCAAYIGQFAGHGNKAADRNGFRPPRRIDMRRRRQARRVAANDLRLCRSIFRRCPKAAAATCSSALRSHGSGAGARHQANHRRGDLGLRYECRRRNIEQDLGFRAPVRQAPRGVHRPHRSRARRCAPPPRAETSAPSCRTMAATAR